MSNLKELFKKYVSVKLIIVVAIIMFGIYVVYGNVNCTGAPTVVSQESGEPTDKINKANVEGFKSPDPEAKPAGPSAHDLLPPSSTSTISMVPDIQNIRDVPAARGIAERIGRTREVNKNAYILNGIQMSQPDVTSSVPLVTNQSAIGPAPMYRNPY